MTRFAANTASLSKRMNTQLEKMQSIAENQSELESRLRNLERAFSLMILHIGENGFSEQDPVKQVITAASDMAGFTNREFVEKGDKWIIKSRDAQGIADLFDGLGISAELKISRGSNAEWHDGKSVVVPKRSVEFFLAHFNDVDTASLPIVAKRFEEERLEVNTKIWKERFEDNQKDFNANSDTVNNWEVRINQYTTKKRARE